MFGLFAKNKRREPERTIPIASYGASREPEEAPKAFQIALSWKGLWALIGVFFILQLWMFLIGMWAAQTIVFPVARQPIPKPPAEKSERAAAPERKAATAPTAPTVTQAPAPSAASATPSSEPAPVAEANLPAPTAEVPPELAGDVDLTPGSSPASSGPTAAPVSGPVFGPEPPPAPAASTATGAPPAMTETKKRRPRPGEETDEGNMAIPPSW